MARAHRAARTATRPASAAPPPRPRAPLLPPPVPRRALGVPGGWSVEFRFPCRQMGLLDAVAPDAADGRLETENGFRPLGARDVPEMLALVERTQPGPFAPRTIELGTYIGVRDGGDLVAMAGERLHPPGFTEISAGCTDASHRGRGLAAH